MALNAPTATSQAILPECPPRHPPAERGTAEDEATAPRRLVLVKNFFEELKRLVPN
jgi:hypothetical protein